MVGPPNQTCFDQKAMDRSGRFCLHTPLLVSLPLPCSIQIIPAMFLLTLSLPSLLAPHIYWGSPAGMFPSHGL